MHFDDGTMNKQTHALIDNCLIFLFQLVGLMTDLDDLANYIWKETCIFILHNEPDACSYTWCVCVAHSINYTLYRWIIFFYSPYISILTDPSLEADWLSSRIKHGYVYDYKWPSSAWNIHIHIGWHAVTCAHWLPDWYKHRHIYCVPRVARGTYINLQNVSQHKTKT